MTFSSFMKQMDASAGTKDRDVLIVSQTERSE